MKGTFVSSLVNSASYLRRKRANSRFFATHNEPFYGSPRPPRQQYTPSRLSLAWQYAWTAFQDPTRADAVAAVGELTGTFALDRLVQVMRQEASLLLKERPIVSKETLPYEKLLKDAVDPTTEEVTFGQAYGYFLKQHGFDPDERDPIRYLEPDSDAAYVMLRYRQCHDFFHTLTGLPPTVPGELGLKWLELFQTELPLAAVACTVGSLRLNPEELQLVWQQYLPWAIRVRQNMKFGQLLCVYYEKEWDTPLEELRQRLGVDPAPRM
ncbi:hypothetical protein FisN_19Hh023 [Fistulifera solaris]|uniref:Ubiquinone biosynthesis protein COQ4 homolog, mitochondrial n=1 Tax=Fistulifera solaris TaxID=1519565 RepID=A0A1Z5K0C8_FISSO|nr:hypothetical protein FisN_19Hh023 [Fistulifera solaris]|eukprot:GAX19451.1 hypothetical protein FisN_19Hh023 [Fistulifera solaris]